MTAPVTIAPELADAIVARRPVVALETSIVAQGLPWPVNRDVARAMADAVTAAGAAPAYTGVLDGRVRLGLDAAAVASFARDGAAKASARDLAWLAATGGRGATTVAGTLRICRAVGLPVMATGGIGGVHRQAGHGLDVSADLDEIAATPTVVVASGAKSILDLPRTLEWLEMRGVPVIGWRTDRFPAFYVADSGLATVAIDDLGTLVEFAVGHWRLGGGGILLVQPAPTPLMAEDVERWTADALAAAADEGIAGAAVTPYLLAAMARASDGATLACNRELAVANAALAGKLAVELMPRLECEGMGAYSSKVSA